jgi:hypothetical protein
MTACKHTVSYSISLPSRGSFHLSITVLVRYRSSIVFSLTGWSPQLHTRFHVSRATQVPLGVTNFTFTGLSPSMVNLSSYSIKFVTATLWSYNPTCVVWALPLSLATTNGISSISFPPVTKMFQFTGFPSLCLFIEHRMTRNYSRRVSPFGYLRIDIY